MTSFPIAACWLEPAAQGTVEAEFWPRKPLSAHEGVLLVNDMELAESCPLIGAGLLGLTISIDDIFALVLPLNPCESAEEMLGALRGDNAPRSGARELAGCWPSVEAFFRTWTPEQAEVVGQLVFHISTGWRNMAVRLSALTSFSLDAEGGNSAHRLIESVPIMREKPIRRELRGPAEYDTLDPDEVAERLEPGGVFERTLDGYEHRAGQIEMARAVTEAFNSSRHLVVEAGTGVGKSVAYLLPSILWSIRNGMPVVVSTNTKNLQSQLFHKDIPMLAHVLGQPFRAALIKGRMNYLCLRHVLRLLEQREGELSEAEFLPLAKVVAWMLKTESGDLDELDRVFAETGISLLVRLPASSEECMGRKCRFYSRCMLQKARLRSLNSDIAVANHSLVFAENEGDSRAIPRHAQLVFDEAHNIEDSATRHFAVEIATLRFVIYLRRLWRAGSKGRNGGLLVDLQGRLHVNAFGLSDEEVDQAFEGIDEARQAVDRLAKASQAYFRALARVPRAGEAPLRYLESDLESERWRKILKPQEALRKALEQLCIKLEGLVGICAVPEEGGDAAQAAEETLNDLQAVLAGLDALLVELDFVTSAKDQEYVFWLDLVGRGPEPLGRLNAAPIDIAQRLVDNVYSKRESVVLCSATLSVNGSFSFLSRRLGLNLIEEDRLITCQAGSPFDYDEQSRVAAATFLPDPTDTSTPYTDALAGFLLNLIRRTRGRTLVLFTSYEMMRSCEEKVAPELRSAGITLLVQGGASRERLTGTFRNEVSSVLFGTDSFWEGVDVMGESLSCVVIARLPFDNVNDPLVRARSERITQLGGDAFRQYSLPNAVIRFRQGFGRLIRHREDRGAVIVADRRIFSKGYGVFFRRNLPCGIRNVAEEGALLDAVEEFLA